MYFGELKIPDELLRALDANEVVFFCGAGVSIPPPSGLPDFTRLAQQIAEQVAPDKKILPPEEEKEDAFLGRLRRDNRDVHKSAAHLLLNRKSSPTELHGSLLRLFKLPEHVRVVTTNFDPHFSTANRKVFGKKKAAEHVAPSLPLGDDFSGIVYLHGAAAVTHRDLVLTDEDFGKAYITKGWASRFLVSLFQRYVVVFIGYSHHDVTMTYLARGLTPFSLRKRYVFCTNDETDVSNWKSLGIQVIDYPRADNCENQHQSLTNGVRELEKHMGLRLSTQLKSVRARVRRAPPEGPKDVELIKHWLKTPPLADALCSSVKRRDWCDWLAENGYFNGVFAASIDKTATPLSKDIVDIFTRFAASSVLVRFPAWLLGLITKNGSPLSDVFLNELVHQLCSVAGTSKKTGKYFGAWINILLRQHRDCVFGYPAVRLLRGCELTKHRVFVLQILECLLQPKITFESLDLSSSLLSGLEDEGTKVPEPELTLQLSWDNADTDCLSYILTDFLPGALPHMAAELCDFATKKIELAHRLVPAAAIEKREIERLDFGRSSIVEHEQDRYGRGDPLNVLIDIARDAMIHLLQFAPEAADSRIASWWKSEIPVFHRLAVFAAGRDIRCTADQLLLMLVDRRLIFPLATRKEAFDVLASAYPKATDASRKHVIDSITGHDFGNRKKDRIVSEYDRFNVLVWLDMHCSSCASLSTALSNITEANPDFARSEHPEFSVWIGKARVQSPSEGVCLEAIRSAPASEYLEELLEAPAYGIGQNRADMCSNLTSLAAADFNWALEFLICAAENTAVDPDLWMSLLVACQEMLSTSEEWKEFQKLLELLRENDNALLAVVWLISRRVWRSIDDVPDKIVELCMEIVDRAWVTRSKVMCDRMPHHRNRYLTAINHHGGWIGESWLQFSEYVQRRDPKSWQGIPKRICDRIREAVNTSDETAVHARIAITPYVSELSYWDPDFTNEVLLPLFDWDRSLEVCQQTWSVWLRHSAWRSNPFERALLAKSQKFSVQICSALSDAPGGLEQFTEEDQCRFGHYLASVAIELIESQERIEFLQKHVALLPPPGRAGVSEHIAGRFSSCEPSESEKHWSEWFRGYLDARLDGLPVHFTSEECLPFVELGITLRNLFPEFVERFERMPLRSIPVYSVIQLLANSDMLKQFPSATCRFLTHVLKCGAADWCFDELISIHCQLKDSLPGRKEFHKLEDAMIRWGCNPA